MPRWRDELPYLAGLAMGLGVLVAFAFPAFRAERLPVNDFSYIWAGARAVLDGHDPYRGADWLATVARYGTQRVPEGFYVYPPHVALALLPLAALPLPVASQIWTLGGMALAAVALRRLLRAAAPGRPVVATLAGLALFASQPGIASYWSGQWTFLLLAALAFAVVGAIEGGAPSSAMALVLLGKPHLFPLAAVGLVRAHLARGRRRLVAALALAAGMVVVVPLLLLPGWLGAWLGDFGRTRVYGGRPPTTVPTALHDVLGAPGTVLGVLILLAALAVALRLDPRRRATLAVWTALSLAAPLYSWSYDHLLLLVPLVMACGGLAHLSARRAAIVGATALASFLLLPNLLYVVATVRQNESFSAVVPFGVFLFTAAVAIHARGRSPDTLPAWGSSSAPTV